MVLGATGQTRLESFLLGSTPEEVARRSPVPV
ncbi:MAG: universal stress protein, partial [Bradymonadaceae bacterium]